MDDDEKVLKETKDLPPFPPDYFPPPVTPTKIESERRRRGLLESKKALQEWAQASSMHGVGKIADTKDGLTLRKIIWLALLLISLGIFLTQTIILILKFFEYNVMVKRADVLSGEMKSPAFTFCPANAVSMKKYHLHSKEIEAILKPRKLYIPGVYSVYNETQIKSDILASNGSCYSTWEANKRNKANPYDLYAGTYVMALNMLSDQQLEKITYNITQLLVDCMYLGMQCSPADFVRIRSPIYGFCYSFNFEGHQPSLGVGVVNSLMLTLAINQSDYTFTFDGSAGYLLSIHEPMKMPQPDKSAYYLNPGNRIVVSISKFVNVESPPPYGVCHNHSVDENFKLNTVSYTKYPFTANYSTPKLMNYSASACLVSCSQPLAKHYCNCFLPCTYMPNEQRSRNLYPCEFRRSMNVSKCYQKGSGPSYQTCAAKCLSECSTTTFKPTFSSTQWPAYKFVPKLSTTFSSMGFMNMLYNRSNEERWKVIRENFLSVAFYYEKLGYSYREVQSAYTLSDLCSDFGGQAGLWLGLSILTIFEIIELIGKVFSSICGRKKKGVEPAESKESLK